MYYVDNENVIANKHQMERLVTVKSMRIIAIEKTRNALAFMHASAISIPCWIISGKLYSAKNQDASVGESQN